MVIDKIGKKDRSKVEDDIEQILITKQQIDQKITKLADQISEDYKGKSLLLVCVLKGAIVFMSDLMRKLSISCEIDFVTASSYGNNAKSSGDGKFDLSMRIDPAGKDILIVEDILDTGYTLLYLKSKFLEMKASSVKVIAFTDKPQGRKTDLKLDYCGFKVPNEFLVGYGLDYAEKYRNLEYIGILKPEIYM